MKYILFLKKFEDDSFNIVRMTKNKFEKFEIFKQFNHSIVSNTRACKPDYFQHEVV